MRSLAEIFAVVNFAPKCIGLLWRSSEHRPPSPPAAGCRSQALLGGASVPPVGCSVGVLPVSMKGRKWAGFCTELFTGFCAVMSELAHPFLKLTSKTDTCIFNRACALSAASWPRKRVGSRCHRGPLCPCPSSGFRPAFLLSARDVGSVLGCVAVAPPGLHCPPGPARVPCDARCYTRLAACSVYTPVSPRLRAPPGWTATGHRPPPALPSEGWWSPWSAWSSSWTTAGRTAGGAQPWVPEGGGGGHGGGWVRSPLSRSSWHLWDVGRTLQLFPFHGIKLKKKMLHQQSYPPLYTSAMSRWNRRQSELKCFYVKCGSYSVKTKGIFRGF